MAQIPGLRNPNSIIRLASRAIELRLQITEELQTTIFEFIDEITPLQPDAFAEEPEFFYACALAHKCRKLDQLIRNPLHRARPLSVEEFVVRVQHHTNTIFQAATRPGFGVRLASTMEHAIEVVARQIEDSERLVRP